MAFGTFVRGVATERLGVLFISLVSLLLQRPVVMAFGSGARLAKTSVTGRTPWRLTAVSRDGHDGNSDGDDDDDDEGFKVSEPTSSSSSASNVLGTTLQCCCANVGNSGIGTGFYRNGFCSTGEQDLGRHTVCVQVTDDFLQFSAAVGNDLSTPVPEYMFPGLRGGDIWCLCAQRWAQAYQAGKAPKLFLRATHEKTLDYVPFEILRQYALDQEEADRNLDDLNEQREKLKKLL